MAPYAPYERKSRKPRWEDEAPWEAKPQKTKQRLKGLRDNPSRGRSPQPWQHEPQRRKSDSEYDSEIAELQDKLDALSRQRASRVGYRSVGPRRYESQPPRKPAIGFQNAADNLSGRNGPAGFIIAFIALLILFATCIPIVVVGG